ncbi:MAG: hypothetical protein LBV12_12100 [Puniceicoccales bacterium]|jgi:hypothetical protein|nr:hypothetical protein [Puniceicoccales bacterium]
MKTLPFALLALLCAFFLAPVSAQAQEKTMDVKGSIPQDSNMKEGTVYVLKNGPAVKKAHDELARIWNVARRHVADIEKFGDEAPKNPKQQKKWEKERGDIIKKFNKQMESYEEALKKYNDVFAENKGEEVSVDDKGKFALTVPATSSFYYSAKKEDRGYMWISKAANTVVFSNSDRALDATIKPKLPEKKK